MKIRFVSALAAAVLLISAAAYAQFYAESETEYFGAFAGRIRSDLTEGNATSAGEKLASFRSEWDDARTALSYLIGNATLREIDRSLFRTERFLNAGDVVGAAEEAGILSDLLNTLSAALAFRAENVLIVHRFVRKVT